MKELGAQLLVKTVQGLADGSLKEIPQSQISNPTSPVLHAPKIFTDTCRIDWNKPVVDIHNLVRGLSPFPGAFTQLEGKTLKIYQSLKEEGNINQPPGTVVTDKKTYLKFACTDGYLHVKELQLEGKKRMFTEDFLRGYRFHQ